MVLVMMMMMMVTVMVLVRSCRRRERDDALSGDGGPPPRTPPSSSSAGQAAAVRRGRRPAVAVARRRRRVWGDDPRPLSSSRLALASAPPPRSKAAARQGSLAQPEQRGADGARREDDVEQRIDGAVSERHQLADRQRGGQRVPIVGVDADETDDEVRRPADDEADDHRHGHLDHVALRRHGQLGGESVYANQPRARDIATHRRKDLLTYLHTCRPRTSSLSPRLVVRRLLPLVGWFVRPKECSKWPGKASLVGRPTAHVGDQNSRGDDWQRG